MRYAIIAVAIFVLVIASLLMSEAGPQLAAYYMVLLAILGGVLFAWWHFKGRDEIEQDIEAIQSHLKNDQAPIESLLFVSGAGYWRAKPLYWILWLVGVGTFLFFNMFVGAAIFAALFVSAAMSRSDWRTREIQRTIRETARSSGDVVHAEITNPGGED